MPASPSKRRAGSRKKARTPSPVMPAAAAQPRWPVAAASAASSTNGATKGQLSLAKLIDGGGGGGGEGEGGRRGPRLEERRGERRTSLGYHGGDRASDGPLPVHGQ